MNVLIVRLSSLGDVVHALPIAANARRAGARVGWLVESAYRELVEGNPDVDEIFFADTREWRRRPLSPHTYSKIGSLFRKLRDFSPNATIDAQGLWKSALLARAAGGPVVGFGTADRREPSSVLLCDRTVKPLAFAHIVDHNLALAEAAGIPVGRRAPNARFLLDRASPEAETFLAGQSRPFAVYHPGASRPEKTWGEERFAALARLIAADGRMSAVVSWGPGDEERAGRMSKMLPQARLLPLLPLSGLARVLAASALFVAGDTGPLHLADALGTPTLALFGSTGPDRNSPARNGPYRSPGSAIRYDSETGAEEVARKAFEVLAA
ncbi:MAG TPA: lipopolysaccharide heptosyltransferase I [Thermoanaerobaculia bacterium]|jgi:lipopolysaccharide heptosyltransferase I